MSQVTSAPVAPVDMSAPASAGPLSLNPLNSSASAPLSPASNFSELMNQQTQATLANEPVAENIPSDGRLPESGNILPLGEGDQTLMSSGAAQLVDSELLADVEKNLLSADEDSTLALANDGVQEQFEGQWLGEGQEYQGLLDDAMLTSEPLPLAAEPPGALNTLMTETLVEAEQTMASRELSNDFDASLAASTVPSDVAYDDQETVNRLIASASNVTTEQGNLVKHFDVLSPFGLPTQSPTVAEASVLPEMKVEPSLMTSSLATSQSSQEAAQQTMPLSPEQAQLATQVVSVVAGIANSVENAKVPMTLGAGLAVQQALSTGVKTRAEGTSSASVLGATAEVQSTQPQNQQPLVGLAALADRESAESISSNLSSLFSSLSNGEQPSLAQLKEALAALVSAAQSAGVQAAGQLTESDISQAVDAALQGVSEADASDLLDTLAKVTTPLQLTMAGKGTLGTQGWGQAFAERMTIVSSVPGQHSVELQLDPPELGALRVKVNVGQDQQVSLTFTSPHAGVRDAVEAQLPRLREMLEAQGLNLADTSFSEGGSDEQGSDRQQQFAGGANGSDEATEVSVDMVVPEGLVDDYA